jgi:hypothetical protein
MFLRKYQTVELKMGRTEKAILMKKLFQTVIAVLRSSLDPNLKLEQPFLLEA